MGIAKTTTDRNLKSEIDQLKARASELQQSIDGLEASRTASQKRRSELAAEREKLVLPARLTKDASAQKRMRAIDEEDARIDHDERDDGVAQTSLMKELESVEQALTRAEWNLQRAEVRKLLVARLDCQVGQNLDEAVANLATKLMSAMEEDRQVSHTLFQFEKGLQCEANAIGRLPEIRAEILAAKLRNMLPPVTNPMYIQQLVKMCTQEVDREKYEKALEALDELELVF